MSSELRKDKIGLSLGAFGYNLGAAGLMTFLTYFYTDSMLISAASVSAILFVSRIIDAITDLLVGALIDRNRSKYGKARPFLMWMALPAIIAMSATFFVPNFSETGRVVYSFITYNLMAFFYLTCLALPLQALVSLITPESRERLRLSQLWGFFSTGSAVIVNFFANKIILALGGGPTGYFRYFTIMAVIGVGLIFLCYLLTKERTSSVQDEKVPLRVGVKCIFQNKYWWIASGIYLMTSLVPSAWAATAYYCIYWLEGAVDFGHVMSLLWGGITVGILLFVPISARVGKAYSAAIGIAMQAFGGILLWLAPTSIPMLWISTVFRSVGVGGLSGNMNAMLADVVEYGEWKTGVRTEGLVYSGASFGGKVGSGLGGAIVAALLAWGNYVPQAATQAPKAMAAIKYAFIAFPFIGSCLIIVMLLLFNVEKLMPQIKADLAARRAQKTV